MVLPIPASIGHFLFFDRAMGMRFLPALGLLNICIVTLFLTAPSKPRGLALTVKLVLAVPIMFALLFLANRNVGGYFHFSELLLGTAWAALAIGLLLDGRRWAFSAVVVIPNILLFGLINPIQRGIDPVTTSPLFEIVHKNPKLLDGKWMVFPNGFPASIFTAVGCDVLNGMRYLPDLRKFPVLAAHGVDTKPFNNLGYVDGRSVGAGPTFPQPKAVSKYGPLLSVDPMDPLLKELGIRYVAFHEHPSTDMLGRI